MKLTYLGTGAAEGMPATFCACPVCLRSLREGGKSLRMRSCALLGDDVLQLSGYQAASLVGKLGVNDACQCVNRFPVDQYIHSGQFALFVSYQFIVQGSITLGA